MRLVSFTTLPTGESRCGVINEKGVVDLARRLGRPGLGLKRLLADDLIGMIGDAEGAAADFGLDEVAFLPVIPDPDKIICVGMNYRAHAQEVGREVTAKPALFARFAESQVGHLQPLMRPSVSREFDYEGELAVVIGKRCSRVPAEVAADYIAGYSCYNDASVRDWQRHTSQFLAGKTFRQTGGFGPWLVSADAVVDPGNLRIETRLNGQVVQSSATSELITPIADLISYCSTFIDLSPGDVIVTGTPDGVGAKRVPPLFMKPGDRVEVEIENIGCLINGVADEAELQPASNAA